MCVYISGNTYIGGRESDDIIYEANKSLLTSSATKTD